MVDIIKFRPGRRPANRFMPNGFYSVRKTDDELGVVLTLASNQIEMSPSFALTLADALTWWANAIEDGQGDLFEDSEDDA